MLSNCSHLQLHSLSPGLQSEVCSALGWQHTSPVTHQAGAARCYRPAFLLSPLTHGAICLPPQEGMQSLAQVVKEAELRKKGVTRMGVCQPRTCSGGLLSVAHLALGFPVHSVLQSPSHQRSLTTQEMQLPRKVSFQQVPVLVVRNSSSLGMQEEDPLQVRGVQDWPFICPYGSQEWGLFSTAVLPALLEQQTHCAEERGWAGSHRAGLSSAVGSLGCL